MEKCGTAGQVTDDKMTHALCWIRKATNTFSEYVIHIAFPIQEWLGERTKYYVIRILHVLLLLIVSGNNNTDARTFKVGMTLDPLT